MPRSREEVVNGITSRYLRPAYPVVSWAAVCCAIILGLLNMSEITCFHLGSFAGRVHPSLQYITWRGSAALPAVLGLFMFFMAYEMWLRKRAALFVFSGFIILQALVDLNRGMPHRAGVIAIMFGLVLLVAAPSFPARTDPEALKSFRIALPVCILLYAAYGILGMYLLRGDFGARGKGIYSMAYHSITVMVGNTEGGIHGWAIAYWVGLTAFAVVGLTRLLWLLFRPRRDTNKPDDARMSVARHLVRRYGSDSLAYFNLRRDKSMFFLKDEAFLAYKVVGDVAVISSDPVGSPEKIGELLESFREYCIERGWRVGGIGANGKKAPLYEDAGFKAFPLGEEAVVNLRDFGLEGRAMRKLRQSVNRLEKMGYSMEFMFNSSIPSHVRYELARISADWRGGKEETGFSMGLGRLLSPEDPDCLLSIAYDGEMRPVGFLYFVPIYPNTGFSLDIHRYKPGTPGSLNEFMIARTAMFLREKGYKDLSLHFLALSQHYREDSYCETGGFWEFLAKQLDRAFPVVSSYKFDKKFRPQYTPRVVLHQSAADLLLIAAAVVVAESALKVTRPSERRRAARQAA